MPDTDQAQTERLLNLVVDPVWYRARHRDVAASGADPLQHFIDSGLRERRDPNRWFDGAWYARQYADVAASGEHPLLHYMAKGAGLRRDPHPRFDAGWYVEQHPEAAGNPLLFHLRVGAARGWLTERPVTIEHYLPSTGKPFTARAAVAVDIVLPVYRGLRITRRCLRSVLADNDRPAGRIIVIDDCSPEPKLSAWLDRLAKTGAITLLRNKKNLGFVGSANRGMRQAGDHDVALLNSDTEVPSGWLRRLTAQSYAAPKIASVSPLSNNASICSYLGYEGGPIPAGMTLAGIDAACQAVNAGRFAAAPTTVGFCMYIRRAALDETGLFDTKTFGRGYGEENDFCLRASALGWRHHIACDTFVRHEGSTSFASAADAGIARAYAILTKRYPSYAPDIAQFVDDAETEAYRFAVTMALFRASGLPTILTISHDLQGGVRRHVHDIVARDMDERHEARANHLLLEPASRGLSLSVPALPGHPKLVLAAERWRDVAAVARSAGVTRVHIHHLLGLDLDVRALIFELGVRFDVTLHDYHAICPQVTLLPWPAGSYCGEPGPAGCDACIANRPSHGATDILSWRLRFGWLFREAGHVNAPSLDALERLRRHGVGENARLLPHEAVTPGPWRLRLPARPGKRTRIAVLGALADHKGAQLVASVVMAADPAKLEIVLIGDTEANFPAAARRRMTITGRYREGELPVLLAKHKPHAIWFPASWPETYSFTLSAAIDAGAPVVASRIGAFPERLAGRPFTWLIPHTLDPAAWLSLFDTVTNKLRTARQVPRAMRPIVRPGVRDGVRPLARDGVRPVVSDVVRDVVREWPAPATAPARRQARGSSLIDLRRDGVASVVVIPETFDDGSFTPCAYIRLMLPLDHPRTGNGVTVTLASPEAAMRYQADRIVTQRHAVAAAEALSEHARHTGAALVYDLDDDLLSVPPDHPEVSELAAKAASVERMLRLADTVRTSTVRLADRIAPLARQIQIVPNALDDRIWLAAKREPAGGYGPVRILCMGTATHDADFAVVLPALTELHEQFGAQIQVDLIGVVSAPELPEWLRRIGPPLHATRSYPGFVHWITRAGPWDIGLAPLADSRFNEAKSAIKLLDYAALGLATVASDVAAYRGLPNACALVANTTLAWYEAVSRLIRDAAARRRLSANGAAHLHAAGTLTSLGPWPKLGWSPARKRSPLRHPWA
jgi:GT2 family glycosyltransferase/glycosyltransferase involved in cell wall biosynthesis